MGQPTTATPGGAPTTPKEGKTYVLVAGACHGGWCWKDVAGRLRAQGHAVYTPTQTGVGERSHQLSMRPTLETFIEDVTQVLRYEDLGEVILVGHSFGGSTVSAIADRMPERLRHLVYLDALLLESGERALHGSSAEAMESWKQRTQSSGGLGMDPAEPALYGITDPQQAAWLKSKLTPHPFQTFLDPLVLQHPLGNGVPATYIYATEPLFGPTAASRGIAQRQPGWRMIGMPTGHNIMMLMPAELAELLAAID